MNTRGEKAVSARRGYAHFVSLILMAILSIFASSCRPHPPSYDGYRYLIIAPEAVIPAVLDFMDYKESKGFVVEAVFLEEILMGTPGDDDPQKVRNYLSAYATSTPDREFVLLVGSMDTVPMRIVYPDPNDHERAMPTDFYYEDLRDNWDADGDGYYGEYGDDMTQSTASYDSDVWIGRIPWDDPDVILSICQKIIAYEEDGAPRMTSALAAGASIFSACDGPILASLVKNFMLTPFGYETTLLSEESCASATPDDALTMYNFLSHWQAKVPGFVVWISHGGSWGTSFVDTWNLPQDVDPAVVVSVACYTASPSNQSLGRVMVRDGIAVSFLGANEVTEWGVTSLLPVGLSAFAAGMDLFADRKALAEAKATFISTLAKNMRVPGDMAGPDFHQDQFLFMLYGDPAVQLK